MILMIDNYDSFVHNLGRYLRQLGLETHVVRNDEISITQVHRMHPQAIVISPGPCTPNEAGCSLELIRELSNSIPILGVCLGHQAIAQAFGGRLLRAKEPMHGRASQVFHPGTGLFCGIRSPMIAGRYHSLVVDRDSLPPCLEITAQTDDGTIMALQHKTLPVSGVQFHPESILTEMGDVLLGNFLHSAGLSACIPDTIPGGEETDPLATNFSDPAQRASS
jgi:anthranilate synthase/aminodeoxychorismate synthase-like glutamine amidotransferase